MKDKLPEFDFDDSNTRAWIDNQLTEYRKTNPAFDLKDFLNIISQKITVFSGDDISITDDELFVVGRKIYAMPPDLKDLPEIDYDDPDVKKWMAAEEAERIRKYGRLTCEEVEYMYPRRVELQKTFPDKSAEELNKIALSEFRSGRKQPITKGLREKFLCANGEYVEIDVDLFLCSKK